MSNPSNPAHLSALDKRELLAQLLQQQVNQPQGFPLSFAQQRLWFLDQLQPNNPFYNEPTVVRLTGVLNRAALQQSLNEIVRRHEALRTTFALAGEQPMQFVAPTLMLDIPVVDLRSLPPDAQEREIRRLATEEIRLPFDLTQGPLVRVTLLQLDDTVHVVFLTMHHIISDGWSMGVFIRELTALYQAFSHGNPSPLPDLPIQYADFAVWQRQWLQGDVLNAHLSYWTQQLGGTVPLLQLPTDRPRPRVQSFNGATQSFCLSPSLTDALQALSRQEGVTLFMTLLAAFKTLLHRYTGQDDILVGSPIANRNRTEIEGLIGFFVNTLVLRTDLSGNPSFREVLGRVREVALAAYTHQDLPFEYVVEALQPERDLSYNPLFQVSFVLQNDPDTELKLPDLTLSSLKPDTHTAKFDLSLTMQETETGLAGTFEYSTDLFDAATLERTIAHFSMLLAGVVAAPDRRISELPLLTDTERHQLLVAWNQREDLSGYFSSDLPLDRCIHQHFEAQAEATPDAVAVVFENQQLTFAELNSRSNQLAHYLRSIGVKPDVLVGICIDRSVEMIVGLLGILKAGGAYVPLDPAYPQARLAFMVADTQIPVLLTNEKCSYVLADIIGLANPTPFVIRLDADWNAIAQHSPLNPVHHTTPDNLAYVIYTSGSTGTPKGVLGCHRGAVNRLGWNPYPLTPDDICCQKTSLNFVDSVWELFAPLLHGLCTVIIPDAILKDLHQFVQTLSDQQVTRIVLVPSLLRVLLDLFPNLQEQLPRLNYWVSSGEALSLELCQRFQQQMPQSILINLYGSSEVSADVTWYDTQTSPALGVVPIGCPIPNIQVYVLDRHMQPVPIGIVGELYVGGEGLARGYLNRPDLTAERFIPDPFSQRSGTFLYRTGDLARYRSNGEIEYWGRVDHQVKLRGIRVEPGDIEAALKQHPQVQDAVVIAREDDPKDRRLVAYVVSSQSQTLNLRLLRDFLNDKLPSYLIPDTLVELEALPLTPNGKVNRQALPAPDRHTQLELDFIAPQTPMEQDIAQIWTELLKLERVGVNDNFFDMGGHSLLATQLTSRVRTTLGVELSLRDLFTFPTIKQMAELVETRLLNPSSDAELSQLLTLLEEMDDT
jgi:amino acid adenylation domain-containing protein